MYTWIFIYYTLHGYMDITILYISCYIKGPITVTPAENVNTYAEWVKQCLLYDY